LLDFYDKAIPRQTWSVLRLMLRQTFIVIIIVSNLFAVRNEAVAFVQIRKQWGEKSLDVHLSQFNHGLIIKADDNYAKMKINITTLNARI
jgi:hypothetical protein